MEMKEIVLHYLESLSCEIKETRDKFIRIKCPICGDGTHKKARGYVLFDSDKVTYTCHNECGSMSFYKFLKQFDPNLANDFLNNLKQKKLENFTSKEDFKPKKVEKTVIKFDFIELFKELKKVIPLTESGKAYLASRGIQRFQNLFRSVEDVEAVVIPIIEDGDVVGYQVRYINEKKFETHNKGNYKVFNLDKIQKGDCLIFESIFDALSLEVENVASALGSDIPKDLKQFDPVICFDNDKTGIEKMNKYAINGFKVCVPKRFPFKDYNEAIQNGWSRQQVLDFIKENTFEGSTAILNLKCLSLF
jgi:hypothetical protein